MQELCSAKPQVLGDVAYIEVVVSDNGLVTLSEKT